MLFSFSFFWQVYSTRYVDQMGIIGYFPATVVKETHKFVQDTIKIPTTVSIFVSFVWQYLRWTLNIFFWSKRWFHFVFSQEMDFYCD